MRNSQSGAGMLGVRMFDPNLSSLARRFRHVRFAHDMQLEVPARSPRADAELYANAYRLRELAAEIIAEGLR